MYGKQQNQRDRAARYARRDFQGGKRFFRTVLHIRDLIYQKRYDHKIERAIG